MLKLERTMDAFERLGVKRTQGYALIKNGLFPPPIKREDRPSRVPSYEVDQVIAATIGGVSEENLRHLVSSLTEQRRNLLEEISNLSSEGVCGELCGTSKRANHG